MSVHEPWCKAPSHSDAAKRLSDTYNLHRIGMGLDSVGKWFGASLAEGRSDDDTLYDSKRDCVLHMKHNEQYYTYIKISPGGMVPCEAEVMIKTARNLYDKGMRMTDPDHKHGGPDLITRLTVEDQLWQARGVVRNLKMPWEA